MILEILKVNRIKVDGDVQVEYKNGKTIFYNSKMIKYLVLDPDSIISIVVNEK